MNKSILRICSILLTAVLLCNMLPVNVWAAAVSVEQVEAAEDLSAGTVSGGLEIVGEAVSGRTEYSKEFKLSNGLHLAAVYNEPVHYEADGQWKEIDNTLVLSGSGTSARYSNTAGIWNVSFPRQLSGSSAVTVEKDGYTLSFRLNGQLRSSGDVSVMAAGAESFSVSSVRSATAQVQSIDLTAARNSAEYPETVLEKNHGRLAYSGVHENTSIVYDLKGNTVKESIVMDTYDPQLRGYSYILELEGLAPTLSEDRQILLHAQDSKEPVMVMPAPYLVDGAGEYCHDVQVTLTGSGSGYVLRYILPQAWLAEADRQWPVVLDPVVQPSLATSNIQDRTISQTGTQEDRTDGSIECGTSAATGIRRIFLRYANLPTLTSADVVVHASITMRKAMTSDSDRIVQVHKLNKYWEYGDVTWSSYFGTNAASNYDHTVVDFVVAKSEGDYTWDVTDIVREWYEGTNTGMMFRLSDEATVGLLGQFWSADYTEYDEYQPRLNIIFRNNNGLESYWDYTASSAGRAGTGYVNQFTGNLVLVREDLGFGGNRMPVSISHVYNANDALNNDFGMGCGWRTNFNQRVYQWTQDSSYYVWEDSDGTDHYFLHTSGNTYKDEDGLELTLTTGGSGDSTYTITDKYGNTSTFNAAGYLTAQINNQQTPSSITVTYRTDNTKLINTITDGAGRVYRFTYSGGLLSYIRYMGSANAEITRVTFGYDSGNLVSVTDKDDKVSNYTYVGTHLLASAQDIDGYKLSYSYTQTAENQPARISGVQESHNGTAGGSLTMEYAHNQTTFTDANGNVQIVQFNDFGNTISIQDSQGHAQYGDYAKNLHTATTGKSNQLTLSSKLQNTVGNMLRDSSFEYGSTWNTLNSSLVTRSNTVAAAHMGSKSMAMTRAAAGSLSGLYSPTFTIPANSTVTFSAYVKTGTGSACIGLAGDSTVYSEYLPANSDWTRMQVSYTNSTAAAITGRARVCTAEAGTTYIDCVQVELAPTASRFNLIENGDFTRSDYGWSSYTGRTDLSASSIGTAPAQQLDNWAYKFSGTYTTNNRIIQTVNISGAKGDCFVLSGWAKGDSVPIGDGTAFGLIATFNYTDGSVNSFSAAFNTDVDSTVSWQYSASYMEAEKPYSSITVIVCYDKNANDMYFDGIQLYRERFGSSFGYDSSGNLTSEKDLNGDTTTYSYNTANDLTGINLPNDPDVTYGYDSYHNVISAQVEGSPSYTLEYDAYGNNTAVNVSGSGGVLRTSAAYTTDGNRLASTKDAMGYVTTYSYNADTNVLEWVKYPKDTDSTRTNYTYDAMYRMTNAQVLSDQGTTLFSKYTYNDDGLLSTIQSANGTTYTFSYGNFAQRSSIKVGSTTLASYSYTGDHNHYLSQLSYGNGDKVNYTYDDLGRVTKQTYEDGAAVSYDYDNDGALGVVTDSATGLTTRYLYDFLGRLAKYTESAEDFSHTSEYLYNDDGQLEGLHDTVLGSTYKTSYYYDDLDRINQVYDGGVKELYTYDTVGRLSAKQTYISGSTLVLTESRRFHASTRGDTGTTTGMVYKQTFSATNYSPVFQYNYHKGGNISAFSDGTNSITYSYDNLGQLIRENNPAANKTWVWTYDAGGNITSRTEYAYTTGTLGTVQSTVNYTYGNSNWKDLLTAYNGQSISYDAIGNPTSFNGWSYTWEHGRQLASMSSGGTTWSFDYNADGLRYRRTNGSTTYTYYYNGDMLRYLDINGTKLYFVLDADGKPIEVSYKPANSTTTSFYFYVHNLMGDVMAILDTSGNAVVKYTYDAWGNIISTTGSMASTLGQQNPFRYRSYVYDHETGLYYLQSRYYNPTIGRFINADALVSTGQGILGNNMFAYCGNNPVNSLDSAGTLRRAIFGDNHLFNPNMLADFGGGGSSYPNGGVSTRGKSITLKEFLDTGDPGVVFEQLETYGISYYKGALVVETPFDASFSYGFIGLSTLQQNADTLKHEYGHIVQLKNMGIGRYITDVVVPSATINILGRLDKLPYDYYTYPFEAEANKLGGSALSNSRRPPLPEGEYTSYWDLIPLFFK